MLIGPDSFPCNITTPERTWVNARVLVWTENGQAQAGIFTADKTAVHCEAVIPLEVGEFGFCNVYPYDLPRAGGGAVHVTRAHGCGCGSILKRTTQKELLWTAREAQSA